MKYVLDSHDFHGNFSPVELDRYLRYIYQQWNHNTFIEMLDRFEIDKNKKIDDMSRGTKSKVVLSIALAHNPEVLILDEITSGLDPSVRSEILGMLRERAGSHGTAIIFSTHLPNDIERIADSVFFLNKGKPLFHYSIHQTRNLYSKYQSTSLEELMLALISRGKL